MDILLFVMVILWAVSPKGFRTMMKWVEIMGFINSPVDSIRDDVIQSLIEDDKK